VKEGDHRRQPDPNRARISVAVYTTPRVVARSSVTAKSPLNYVALANIGVPETDNGDGVRPRCELYVIDNTADCDQPGMVRAVQSTDRRSVMCTVPAEAV